MSLNRSWAALALAGTALGLAGQALAATAAPPITQIKFVGVAPVNPVPDAQDGVDPDQGLEAREAMGMSPAPTDDPAISDALNAQYATLRLAQARVGSLAPALSADAPSAPQADAPQVALARRVVESAVAFGSYMQRASAVRPDFADAQGVGRALEAGGVYEPAQLEEGAVAYAALAALQDPMFVRAVEGMAQDPQARAGLAGSLAADPSEILQAPGAVAAGKRAAAALGRMGAALYTSGAAVKRSAYEVQRQPWSRASIAGPEAALLRFKAESAVRRSLAADDGRALAGFMSGMHAADADAASADITPVIARSLTLAALAVLGQAGEEHADRIAPLLSDAAGTQCMKMARLNLYQCLSAAGPNYENVFCLGQHAMMETARCVMASAAWSPAAAPVQAAAAAEPERPAPVPASIMVPIAASFVQARAEPSPGVR